MALPERRPAVGCILPLEETHMAGRTARWRDLQAMAREAEVVGFDSVWTSDHLLLRNPGEPTHGVWECWTLMAALAACTSAILIGSQVTCQGFRNPGLLARMADTVDEIGGGRLVLGIGSGDHEPDHLAFGIPFSDRVSRAEEYVAVLTELLRRGRIDHVGRYFRLVDCAMPLRGPRPLGPPVVVAAQGPRMLRLAARHGDGWMVFDQTAEAAAELEGRFRDACAAEGRDPHAIERYAGGVVIRLPGAVGVPWQTAPALEGDPAGIANGLRRFAEAGFGHILVWPDPNSIDGVAAMQPVLAALHSARDT